MTIGRPTLPPTEASLLDILEERARTVPDRQVFCYLEDGELESQRFTYSQLLQRAQALAARMQRCSAPGDRALLLYPFGIEFIAALFGCFYSGLIAIPAQPPRLDLKDAGSKRLAGIARHSQPSVILTGGHIAQSIINSCHALPEMSACQTIVTDEIDEQADGAFHPLSIERKTIALLQYTSGSTGDPRAVVITHGNILANQYVLQLAFHHRTSERPGTGVCWLPFYHDMGLIGNILQAVYVDAPCYLMSPLTLLQRPLRWLEAISRYRAHSSGGPNFAYDLCVQRISEEQKATLDLSSWEIAAIGAEPISHATIDRFSEAFAGCGFRREAFYPCYGLAEATLFVSGGEKDSVPTVRTFHARDLEFRGDDECCSEPGVSRASAEVSASAARAEEPRDATLVGCGHAWTDHEIKIVHPGTRRECLPGSVGEIWFRGPSVAQGYWGRPDDSDYTFNARLVDLEGGPFLRTGDLGLLVDGELFVSGRMKDLIVIRGHNHYPQDIEDTVSQVHEAFAANAGAACGIPCDDGERLVILQEIDRKTRELDLDDLARAIRREIAERHQLQVHEVLFLKKGTLPKTTSGKIRRHECRRQYLAGDLVLWTPPTRK